MSATLLVHQISEACDIISIGVGYIDQVVADQGFIADGSYSDLRLANYAQNLRGLADQIEARRAALIDNEPVPFLMAAE